VPVVIFFFDKVEGPTLGRFDARRVAGPLKNARRREPFAMVWIDQGMKCGRGRDFAFALVKHNHSGHYLPRARAGVCIFVVRGLEHLSRPADARQQPSHDSVVRLAAAALKLVLLDGPFGESRGLIGRLSLVLRKRHSIGE